ncbi:MAG: hypothetical protein ACOC1F_06365 [Myxococcota bacterium]
MLTVSVCAALACVKPMQVPLSDLVNEVQSDEVAALDKYAGRLVQVGGTISHKGLKTKTELGMSFNEYSRSATVSRSSEQVPFAVMEVASGSVVCFFENRKEAAALAPGQRAVFEGVLYRVKNRGEMALIYLRDCSLAEGAKDDSSAWEI